MHSLVFGFAILYFFILSFHKVGCNHVCSLDQSAKRGKILGAANGIVAANNGFVKARHMPTDSQKLVNGGTNEPLEDDTAFFTVTEGESFVNFPNLLL